MSIRESRIAKPKLSDEVNEQLAERSEARAPQDIHKWTNAIRALLKYSAAAVRRCGGNDRKVRQTRLSEHSRLSIIARWTIPNSVEK